VTGQRRAGLVGAGALLLQLGLWWLFGAIGMPVEQASTVLAIVAIAGLGLLPRLAVLASGLAGSTTGRPPTSRSPGSRRRPRCTPRTAAWRSPACRPPRRPRSPAGSSPRSAPAGRRRWPG
jgi:hypothetical protein